MAEHIFFDGVLAILESEYLEKEKQQIIDAHEAGQDIISIDSNFTDSIQYYENTFNTTNKETLKKNEP